MKKSLVSSSILMSGAFLFFANYAIAEITPPCQATPEAFAEVKDRVLHLKSNHIIVVAHRSCHLTAPENTPAAIDICWREGVEVVENDVRMTKDGHMVIFHDDEISRMTDRWGYVEDLTLDELRKANLKERSGEPGTYVTNMHITTIEEYFAAIKNKVMVNYEIKASGDKLQIMLDQSIDIARKMGVLDHLIFKIQDIRSHGKTFGKSPLEGLKIPPDVMVMPMIWQSEAPIPQRLDYLEKFSSIGYEMDFQTEDYIKTAQTDPRLKNKPIMMIALQPYWSGGMDDEVSVMNADNGWGKLIAYGGDYIMTDRPEVLLKYLESKNLRQPRLCRIK